MNIEEIYQKKRITAQEVFETNNPELLQAKIVSHEIKQRKYKDEEYNYIKLNLLMNGKERTLDLKRHNAEEISRVAGVVPEEWKGIIIQLTASKQEGDFPKLFVFVSQQQPRNTQALGMERLNNRNF